MQSASRSPSRWRSTSYGRSLRQRICDERLRSVAGRPVLRRADGARVAARRLHGARLHRREDRPVGRAGPGRAVAVPAERCARRRRHGLEALRGRGAAVQPARRAGRLRVAAPAGRAAAESAGLRCGVGRFVVQHGRQFRHQHQLAGLRRRIDDELPDADARARRAELRVGRDRNGGARRIHPRLCPQAVERSRQFLGRHDALDALCAAAAVAGCCAGAGLARRGAELQQGGRRPADAVRRGGHTGQGRRAREEGDDHDAVSAAGAGRVAGRDQAARHQRRRILQRQLGASLREPDAVLEFRRSDLDPADIGGAVLHVRAAGQRCAPGLGDLRRDERDLPGADLRGGRRRGDRRIRA